MSKDKLMGRQVQRLDKKGVDLTSVVGGGGMVSGRGGTITGARRLLKVCSALSILLILPHPPFLSRTWARGREEDC